MAEKKINVNGLIIRTSKINQNHYISLTDLAKARKAKPAATILFAASHLPPIPS